MRSARSLIAFSVCFVCNLKLEQKLAESHYQGVRRVTLSRIRYYLYYRVADDALQVLALWHTSRGLGPSL